MTGTLAFQLYLMSQMRGEAPIASALAALGLTPEDARAAATRMGHDVGFDRVGHEINLYRQTLGDPLETTPEPGISTEAFAGSLRHRFHLPLWPAFDFIVRSHRDGWAWGPEFIRGPGAAAPGVRRPEDMQPWSIIESEVLGRFGPFASEDAWNAGKDGSYLVDEAGRPFEVSLLFDFALFQRVIVSARRSVRA